MSDSGSTLNKVLLWVSIMVVLGCLAVAGLIIFLPDEAPFKPLLTGEAEIPQDIAKLAPKKDPRVEKTLKYITSSFQEQKQQTKSKKEEFNALPSSSNSMRKINLTEKEMNSYLKYEIESNKFPQRGVTNLFLRFKHKKIVIHFTLDGKKIFDSLPTKKQNGFPSLLKRKGNVTISLTPHKDILDRVWLKVDSVHIGNIPIPSIIVNKIIKQNIKGFEYNRKDGLRLPDKIVNLSIEKGQMNISTKY